MPIVKNIYSDVEVVLQSTINENNKSKRQRGRPKGSGRKHADRTTPKTFRHFSALAHGLISLIRLGDPDLAKQSDADVVEEALVRMARSMSNQNPLLADQLRKAGR